ncbi:MAG: 23S rRNA (pseudouridine(1915)-N(3))-methyltransferase RlmH [Thermoleophilia bacterium]|nr:23S rRNA (pseudouridine(1915)-N(3))-methyltransferase RlmH [Thermoleophilia bacterium]
MMEVHLTRVDLVVVGTLSAELADACADYERRLGRYVKLHVHELKSEPTARGEQVVLRSEGARMAEQLDRIERQVADTTTIVVLDPAGAQPTTEQLVERWLAVRHLVLVIGGSMGIARDVRARATATVAFGRITLPHQIARLVATEQLYRCFRIARGEPYHY